MSAILYHFTPRFANDNVRFCAARAVEREWFTQKAVADYLGVKVMTVWRYEHGYTDERGNFHPPREGFPKPSTALGRKMWRKADLVAFMAS
jgi:hypothetical protein